MFCSHCGAQHPQDAVFCPSCGKRVQHGPMAENMDFTFESGPKPADAVAYGGFWKRFVAYVLDTILLSLAMFAAIALCFAVAGDLSDDELDGLASLFSFLGSWLYFAFFESSAKQATPGKMALGMRVVDLNGGRISFGHATGRYFGKIVSSLLLGIGFIMAGVTARKQALHDIMAKCLVVNQ